MAAAASPSVGDTLMLSQLAWKICRSFTSAREGAPSQFREIEDQLKSLTHSLTLLATTLDEDSALLEKANFETQEGLTRIIGSCSQSLHDLEAFVSQYQEIERPGGAGGAGVKRSWRQLLVRNYRTVMWTSEGGSIETLRNTLAVHTQSLSLATQGLQTRSVAQLESIIEPVTDQIDQLRGSPTEELDAKFEEIQHVMLSLQASIQQAQANTRVSASPSIYPAPLHIPDSAFDSKKPLPLRPRRNSWAEEEENPLSPSSKSLRYNASPRISEPGDNDDNQWAPSPSIINSRSSHSLGTMGSTMRASEAPSETTRYADHSPFSFHQPAPKSEQHSRQPSLRSYGGSHGDSPASSRFSKDSAGQGSSHWSAHQPLTLPPPALPTTPTGAYTYYRENSISDTKSRAGSQRGHARHGSYDTQIQADQRQPSVFSNSSRRYAEEGDALRNPSRADSVSIANSARQWRPSEDLGVDGATPSEQAAFVRDLFTNAAVLSDIPGKSVDYTQPDDNSPGDWLMTNACGECKIYVITKGQVLPSGKTRFVTSIWSISNDRSVRLQQKLPLDQSIIPYTVWGNSKTVVLRVPATLKYHDTGIDGKPVREATTSWVSYVFDNDQDAGTFQTALMDKTILLSVKTKRTMRIFDGIKAPFAFAEQLCGLENLRIVANHDTGLVHAMLHYSPSFTEGYMEFPLNSLVEDIRIKDEPDTPLIRIKGLKIPVPKNPRRRLSSHPESPVMDKASTKTVITGAKIEFSTAKDKRLFMEKLTEVRKAMASAVKSA